jgi:hypothetical protein
VNGERRISQGCIRWLPPATSEHNTEGKSSGGGWFRIYNALSELDSDGEYVIESFGEVRAHDIHAIEIHCESSYEVYDGPQWIA